MNLQAIENEIRSRKDIKRAEHLKRFFKTGKGEYAYGDLFLGITVPQLRRIAKEFQDCPLAEIKKLLRSRYHEERFVALLLMLQRYEKGTPKDRRAVYEAYLSGIRHINNWDLVDLSATGIVGAHLSDRSRSVLYRLAGSKYVWERRIAIVATFHGIKQNDLRDTFALSELLISDTHDLIHKATGWMLREAGKKNSVALESFLREHARVMPRTMLRYAIERFPEKKRKMYLAGNYS